MSALEKTKYDFPLVSKKVKVHEEVTITPEMAGAWLAHNHTNRKIKENIVKKYMRDMQTGKWGYNGDSIRFNINGDLCDGQHRLTAIARSGISIQSVVVTGLPLDSLTTIDTGKPRSTADILYLGGEADVNNLAAALRIVYLYFQTKGELNSVANHKILVSSSELEETLEKHPHIRDSLRFVAPCKKEQILTTSIAGALHYLFSLKDREMADDFFERLAYGNDLQDGHPILALRNKMIRDRNTTDRRGSTAQVFRISVTIKAWNKFRLGEKAQNFMGWMSGEVFPKIV